MGDLSAFVPQQSATVNQIYAYHKAKGDAEPQRGYLGASIIGHECERYLWFTFRGVVREEIPGRIYRLFETGDLEEARFVKELRAIGCEVIDVDENGEQIEIMDLGGHFSGHMDAAILGVHEAPKAWHVGEFKTHNDKSFAKLLKEGVRSSKPVHWAQMQVYMGKSGMRRALYLARNKNTDALYAERVKLDNDAYKALMAKAARIIRTSQAPERLASRGDDWRCKFCSAYTLCWGIDHDGVLPIAAVPIPSKTCRSCCNSTPLTEGEGPLWECAKFKTVLPSTDVGADCPAHLLLPGMVSFAEPVDADEDWIEFKSTDGTVWRHGRSRSSWSTDELLDGRGPLGVEMRKHIAWSCGKAGDCKRAYCEKHSGNLFLCSVCNQGEAELDVSCPGLPADLSVDFGDLPLLARYPWGDSERVWDGHEDQLEAALSKIGCSAIELNAMEPSDHQDDARVNAAEYRLSGGDYLIVLYKQDHLAAIWRGKA